MANRNLFERPKHTAWQNTTDGMQLRIPPSPLLARTAKDARIDPFASGGTTQLYPLGTELWYGDRKFKYAKMGGTAGAAGKLYQMVVPLAGHIDEVIDSPAVGDTTIAFTPNTQTTDDIAADALIDGYILINDEAGEGYAYRIKDNPAIVGGTSGSITLTDPIVVSPHADATATVFYHYLRNVIIHPSPPTAMCVGVCPCVVTANEYCWLQTWGPCPVLTDGTIVIGQEVRPSEDDDGGVAALDYDEATQADHGAVGRCMAVCADGEYSLIYLTMS